MQTELVVLGGGPAGYAAAFRAADMGIKTTIVEQNNRLGGVCLLQGCIPSKALLHVARGIARVEEMREWGVEYSGPKIDIDTVRSRKNKVISDLVNGLEGVAKKRNVNVIRARAFFESSRKLRLEGDDLEDDRLEYEKLILCAGSQPAVPEPLRLDDDRVMNSQEALSLPEIPKKLLVIGGAYVGLEMATTYSRLGSDVTVVEMLDQLMPGVDKDLVAPLRKSVENEFQCIHLSTRVENIKPAGEGLEVSMASQDKTWSETYDRVLVAVGRQPRSEKLNLQATDVEVDENGFVQTDEQQCTSDKHILAAGDIAGQPLLAHKAFAQGTIAAETAADRAAAFEPRAIPAIVFTDPEIAWTGFTEAEAKAAGLEIDVARYPWAASGRAHAIGRTDGRTKLIFDKKSARLIGAGIVGSESGELIAECTLAMEMGCTSRDLADTIHAHPTLGETVTEAAALHLGEAREIYRKR